MFPLAANTTFTPALPNGVNVSEFGGGFTVKFTTDVSPVSARVQTGGSWITLDETGADYVKFTVTTNSSTNKRVDGSLLVCDTVLPVRQSGFGSTKWLPVPTTEQSIGWTDGSLSFPVLANPSVSWTVVSSADWLTLNTAAGQGSGTVSYSVSSNRTSNARWTTVTVQSRTVSGATVDLGKVKVSQDAKGTSRPFGLDADVREISASGGTLSFNVIGATGWTVKALNDDNTNTEPNWLSFSTVSNETTQAIAYTVQPQNINGGGIRKAKFTVTSGGTTREMKLSQLSQASGSDNAIELERSEEKGVSFAGATGTLNFNVKASWCVEHTDWIAVSPSAGVGNDCLTYTVASNDTAAVRTGEIIIKSGSVSKKFTVTQNRFISVPEALDNDYGYIITGSWEGQTNDSHDGRHAARVNGNSAGLDTVITNGPGILTFWWKADDGAAFSVKHGNGVVPTTNLVAYTGTGWQLYSNSFDSVTNVFTWSFAGSGDQVGYLDQVVWTYTPPPVLTSLAVNCDTLSVVGERNGSAEAPFPIFTCDTVFSDGSVKPGVEARWFIPKAILEAHEDISLGDSIRLVPDPDGDGVVVGDYAELEVDGGLSSNVVIQVCAVYAEDDITLTNAVSIGLFPGGAGTETVVVEFDPNGGTVSISNGTYVVGTPYGVLPEPVCAGYTFKGWVTQDGEPVTVDTAALAAVTLLSATWEANGESGGGGGEEPGGDGGGDSDPNAAFDGKAANTYIGWMMSERTVAGTTATAAVANVTLKTAKLSKKGDSKITAKVVMAGSKFTLKGTGTVTDGTCAATLTAKGKASMTVRIRKNTFEGTFGADKVAGYRNVFASKSDALQSQLGSYKGTWTGVCSADVTDAAKLPEGYGALSVKVAAKGKAKLAGFMPDGTKISVSAQLLVVDAAANYGACLPFYDQMYSGNKGGLGGVLWLGKDGTAILETGWALDWKTAKPANNTLCSFTGNKLVAATGAKTFALENPEAVPAYGTASALTELLPTAVSFTASKGKWTWPKAAKVAKDGTTAGLNPSGVKLTYTSSTGLFKGKFTVYYLVSGKLKKVKANVQGAVLNGNAYDAAIINGTSLPVRGE